jgi:hypothetical protein
MDRLSQQVEHVAQVFYATRGAAPSWDEAPEVLKDELHLLANAPEALALEGEDGQAHAAPAAFPV